MFIIILFCLQVSLAVFVIMNVTDLELRDKVTVGVGVPFQLAWSILGWCAVSIKKNLQ